MTTEYFEGSSADWEAIDADEVERVVEALDDLIEEVQDDTVKMYLHAACEDIARLVSWDDDEDAAAA